MSVLSTPQYINIHTIQVKKAAAIFVGPSCNRTETNINNYSHRLGSN